jgi:MFS family permease
MRATSNACSDTDNNMLPITDTGIAALSHIIQVSVAPVFLLTGIGSILGVLANRLGRIVDRARFLESRPNDPKQFDNQLVQTELLRLAERKRWINRAITLCTVCALLVCTVIATLFVGAFVSMEIGVVVAGLFVLSMLALIAGLICFLREIYVAVHKERTPRR